jgi:hypothetical protein
MMNPGFNALSQLPGRWNTNLREQLLLIESDPGLCESRRLLLASLGVPVHAVHSHLEVFQQAGGNRYNLIVLDVLRDPEHAPEIAEFARVNWPEAKILLLGPGCGSLDDWLYDDLVDPYCNPAGVIESAKDLLDHARAERIIQPRN